MKVKCNSKICRKKYCPHKKEHEKKPFCVPLCSRDEKSRCVTKQRPQPIDGTMYGSIYTGKSTPLKDVKTLLELLGLREITKGMR